MSLTEKIKVFVKGEINFYWHASVPIRGLIILRVLAAAAGCFFLGLLLLSYGLLAVNPTWDSDLDFLALFLSLGSIIGLMLLPHRHIVKRPFWFAVFILFNFACLIIPVLVRVFFYLYGAFEAESIFYVIRNFFMDDSVVFMKYVFFGLLPTLFLLLNRYIYK